MCSPWPTRRDWLVSIGLYFKISSIIHGITAHCSACGMPHGPRPRSLISLDQGFKGTGGSKQLGRDCILPACTTFIVRTIALFAVCIIRLELPTLLLFNVDMYTVTLTLTSSWLWSVGAWFENLEQSWSSFYFRSRSGIGWLRLHKATIFWVLACTFNHA
jgi:hypothetical protein